VNAPKETRGGNIGAVIVWGVLAIVGVASAGFWGFLGVAFLFVLYYALLRKRPATNADRNEPSAQQQATVERLYAQLAGALYALPFDRKKWLAEFGAFYGSLAEARSLACPELQAHPAYVAVEQAFREYLQLRDWDHVNPTTTLGIIESHARAFAACPALAAMDLVDAHFADALRLAAKADADGAKAFNLAQAGIKRAERMVTETKTATELWAADDQRHEEATAVEMRQLSGHVHRIPGQKAGASEVLAREYLISKYGDNVRAYDAWIEAGKGEGAEGYTALFEEVFEWQKKKYKATT
jgi:hypothetical protein